MIGLNGLKTGCMYILLSLMEIIKQYNESQLTILNVNNEPWFRGKDVALILGYKNTRDALIKHVDEEDKKSYENFQPSQNATTQNIDKKTVFINESGVYALIFSSKLKSAKQFKRWVTSEVLPSIRKTGKYEMNKHEQNKLILSNIKDGVELMKELGVLNPLDKLYFGSQVKNLLKDEQPQNNNIIEYPLTRRLKDHGINYKAKDKGNLIKAGQKLRKLYMQKYNRPPTKRNEDVGGAVREVNIYTNEDFDIMDEALRLFFEF